MQYISLFVFLSIETSIYIKKPASLLLQKLNSIYYYKIHLGNTNKGNTIYSQHDLLELNEVQNHVSKTHFL